MFNLSKRVDLFDLLLNSNLLYKFTCDTSNSVYLRILGYVSMSILRVSLLTNKPLRCSEKRTTSFRKYCHQHSRTNGSTYNCKVMAKVACGGVL